MNLRFGLGSRWRFCCEPLTTEKAYASAIRYVLISRRRYFQETCIAYIAITSMRAAIVELAIMNACDMVPLLAEALTLLPSAVWFITCMGVGMFDKNETRNP